MVNVIYNIVYKQCIHINEANVYQRLFFTPSTKMKISLEGHVFSMFMNFYVNYLNTLNIKFKKT